MNSDNPIQTSSGEPVSQKPGQLDVAVVIPTYNERDNVPEIIRRLDAVLGHLRYEIIFVDDNSPDGTSDVVRDRSLDYPRVRCVTRVGRRGLSSAAIEGMMATTAPVVAVIDGDMQHDEAQLPAMLDKLNAENLDVVVGSRYAEGGGFGEWSDRRRRMSELATSMAKRLTGVDLSDPMSGFFMVRSASLREKVADLTGVGYKILLDLLSAPGKQLTVGEVPYEFRTRELGESKLDSKVILEFAELLIARTVGRWVPTKFIMFSIVGASGVIVHMLILTYLFRGGYSSFFVAQATATIVAMTTNFLVNNFFTYYDRQLRGWKLIPGWLSFCAASSVGAVANLGVAVYMFETAHVIWFASALAGVIVGSAWNYAVTALLTWKS
ncbi:MAG: glycosyltransferase family 2 protein [Marinosulfonomonas sp.]